MRKLRAFLDVKRWKRPPIPLEEDDEEE